MYLRFDVSLGLFLSRSGSEGYWLVDWFAVVVRMVLLLWLSLSMTLLLCRPMTSFLTTQTSRLMLRGLRMELS